MGKGYKHTAQTPPRTLLPPPFLHHPKTPQRVQRPRNHAAPKIHLDTLGAPQRPHVRFELAHAVFVAVEFLPQVPCVLVFAGCAEGRVQLVGGETQRESYGGGGERGEGAGEALVGKVGPGGLGTVGRGGRG